MHTVADKLREARALVAKGWCQGEAHRGDNYCILGAVGAVNSAGDGNRYFEMSGWLREAAQSPTLASWNDAEGRTQAEVLAAFDRAIELAEAGQ